MTKASPFRQTMTVASIGAVVAFAVAKWLAYAYSTNFGLAFLVTFFSFILLVFQFRKNVA